MIERPVLTEISKYVPSPGLSRCVQPYYRHHSDYNPVAQPSSLKAAESITSLQPASQYVTPTAAATAVPAPKANTDLLHFIEKQEGYIEQLERESHFCRVNYTNLLHIKETFLSMTIISNV